MPFFSIVLILVFFLILIAFFMTEKGTEIRTWISFFAHGLDSGFKPGQIILLGTVGRATGLDDLTSLYWSLPALDRCTAEIVRRSRQSGSENEASTQLLLSKLYAYRTGIELDQAKKKRGIESTRDIQVGQKVRILLHGAGVFSSRVMKNNVRDMVLDFPASPTVAATSIDWVGKTISVYFWRHEDAGYVFDTVILPDPANSGKAIVHVSHTRALLRSQKRKSIRAKCSLYAQMYLLKPGDLLDNNLESDPGMKCLLEDLSESGAMIIIGGKAIKNMKIKLQFVIHDVVIVMAGLIRGVEFNSSSNQSRIHFECENLNPRMKNTILTFVYNILPEDEKERLDAIRLTEEDGLSEQVVPGNDQSISQFSEHSVPGNEDITTSSELPDFVKK